jgi:protein phosphatase
MTTDLAPDRGTTVSMPMMRAYAAGLSDVGLQREHNEDSFIVLNDFDLYVVADGMGGHRAGDVASRIATETIGEFFKSTANDDVTWPFHFDTNLSEEENRLLTGIRVANRQIFERSTRSRECQGMGTTVVSAMFSLRKQRMYIGHVGDSRCYRVRHGKIQQLTRDHSLVNDYLVAMPDLTDEQRSELPKNVITRALGMQDHVVVDLQHDDPQLGDVYVICSDGLSGMLADEEIEHIVTGSTDIRSACRKLIEKANDQGGEDNITAVLIKIEAARDPADVASDPEFARTASSTDMTKTIDDGEAERALTARPDDPATDDTVAAPVHVRIQPVSDRMSDPQLWEAETLPGTAIQLPPSALSPAPASGGPPSPAPASGGPPSPAPASGGPPSPAPANGRVGGVSPAGGVHGSNVAAPGGTPPKKPEEGS